MCLGVIASEAKQSIAPQKERRKDGLLRCARNDGRGFGLLRGACHRARIRATRWLLAGNDGSSPRNGSDGRDKALFANDQLGCEFAQRTATDIRRYDRYINPARHHVRAFAVGWDLRMTGSTRSSSGLDDRRKRLLFRCWHRGTREMDLILGRFADAEIASLKDDELAQLEHLIEVPDPDLYAALSGDVPLAPEYATDLFDRIKSFRSADHDV